MFDISWSKLLVIAILMLIVIGPKDLIPTLRTLGRMVAKMRQTAAEFQQQFTQAMREVELDEVQRELATMNREVATAIDPAVRASPTTGSAGSGGGSTVPPPPHEADRAPTETIHDQPSSPAPADKRTGES